MMGNGMSLHTNKKALELTNFNEFGSVFRKFN